MSDTLSLVASITVGTLLLLTILRFHGNAAIRSREKTIELLTQERTASIMEVVEHDFRRFGGGLGLPLASVPILDFPNRSDITFLADTDGDGTPETVRYYLGSPLALAETDNTADAILYRVVDGTVMMEANAGITDFSVTLMDMQNRTGVDFSEVRIIEISLEVQGLLPYSLPSDSLYYPTALWTKRITPLNLAKQDNLDF